jgi:hypothetical protein
MSDWWINYPWRLIQTNLREIDMLDINAQQVVADLQSFKATVLMINAAGIIASYPTKIPYHFQSPFLKGDSLKIILQACHDANIKVLARTDFSKVRRPIFEDHPSWAYRSRDGKIIDYNGDVHVCVNSWYQQEGILHILAELFTSHNFDGVFFNMGGYITSDYSGNYYGICHCENCRIKFMQFSGLDLPIDESTEDNAFDLYKKFKDVTLRQQAERIQTFLSSRWPELCIANFTDSDRGFIRQESNTSIDRPLPLWQYSASENTRWAVNSHPQMISSNTTVDFIDFPYRHSAVSPHQQALRLAQNLAAGGSLDYYLIGRLDNHADQSGFENIKRIFHYHDDNVNLYEGIKSKASVALIRHPQPNNAEYRGWFRTLVENHFLFDLLTIQAVEKFPLENYQIIIIPNIPEINLSLAEKIDKFVENGGQIIVSGETGLHDQDGTVLSKPAFNCLGVEQVDYIRKDTRSAYFKINEKELFPGLLKTQVIYLEGTYIYATYSKETEVFLQLIPPHQYGPPERCYYTYVTEHPGFAKTKYGKGAAIFIPWLPGSLFYCQGQISTSIFIANLLEHASNTVPVKGNLPEQVEITLHELPNRRITCHIVNTSGHFGNSFYAPIKMIDLKFSLPMENNVSRVSERATKSTLNHFWENGWLTIELPSLELFNTILIEF